jgi:V8-like Glu-specific endopeptidase
MKTTAVAQVALAACFSVLVGCAIEGPDARDRGMSAPEQPDGRTPPDDARTEQIVGGSEATQYPSAAIVNMKQGGWQVSSCSGAVIAPRIVLTAGHCVVGEFDNWTVRAPYASNQTATSHQALVYDWTSNGETVDPNQHDVALLVLDSPIQLAVYPEIASSAVSSSTKVRNIGRINNGVMSNTRLYVSQPLSVVSGSSYGYPYDYASSEVIESGDSGGPVVVDNVLPHRIVAVNSGAGGGIQVLARVDLVRSWIVAQIAAHGDSSAPPPPPAACQHPICEEGGKLAASCDACVQQICAADAYCCSTAWDGQCVSEVASICSQSCSEPPPPPPPPPADPCGGVTYAGQCSGATLSWCENEQVHTVDCAASGKQCLWDASANWYNCL